jgi:hypothetical protein
LHGLDASAELRRQALRAARVCTGNAEPIVPSRMQRPNQARA